MSKYIPFFLILLIHLFLLSNIQFTAWPEMLSYPYLFSNGFALYKDFLHPYPPFLTILLSSVYSVFGFKIATLQVFTWLYILLSDVVLFFIVKNISKKNITSYLLLITYVLVQSFLDGNMLWFDNALVLPLVASFYFFLKWLEKKKDADLYLLGLSLGVAVLIKQTALLYLAVMIFLSSKKILIAPVGLLFAFVVYLIATNSFGDFWNWAIYYPFTFWSKYPGYKDLSLNSNEIKILFYLFSPLVFSIFAFKNLIKRKDFVVIVSLFAASIVAVYPRFSFFHLQPAIAIFFVIYAYILSALNGKAKLIFISVVFICALSSVKSVFPWNWGKSVRFYSKDDRTLIKMVNILSQKDEKVFLLGIPSQIYVLAERFPPKPWADNFGWYYEIPGFQQKVIEGFEKDPPDKIFVGPTDYKPEKLITYTNSNYYLEGEPIEGYELWRRK